MISYKALVTRKSQATKETCARVGSPLSRVSWPVRAHTYVTADTTRHGIPPRRAKSEKVLAGTAPAAPAPRPVSSARRGDAPARRPTTHRPHSRRFSARLAPRGLAVRVSSVCPSRVEKPSCIMIVTPHDAYGAREAHLSCALPSRFHSPPPPFPSVALASARSSISYIHTASCANQRGDVPVSSDESGAPPTRSTCTCTCHVACIIRPRSLDWSIG